MNSLPALRSRQLTCQFGLSRCGLYSVAEWFIYGRFRSAAEYEQIRAGWIDDIEAPLDGAPSRFVTLESLREEYLKEGLDRAGACGANTWIQLRDPYNWVSSLYRGVETGIVRWTGPVNLDKWKQYARVCRENGSWLSFNEWFSDACYRRNLATRWKFTRNCDGQPWKRIPDIFAGSSFDERRFQGRADEMAILERYRVFASEQWWRNLFDEESIELARDLFGMERPW